jgi:hypothetical protein
MLYRSVIPMSWNIDSSSSELSKAVTKQYTIYDQNYTKCLCLMYFDFNVHQGGVYSVTLIESTQCSADPSGREV